ncbi:ABC transporter permease subunit, partial [Bradyrhizobium sp. SHOUNA76]|uniref:ABC transporter permease subunit n=1 Tax=Bradyrhizobium sp. SHOUNA76 TaxID=2908927 RepID=UPI003857B63C|nr:hypothetical protein [Bradyrhizobium sp. SHOUNA76]
RFSLVLAVLGALIIQTMNTGILLSGYPPEFNLLVKAVYVWCGVCAALAGVIAAADIMGADANNAGLWLELDAILAVVIGGTSLFGGRFSLVLAVLGALIIQTMNTGILLSGYPPEFNLLVKAVVVLAVLLLQSPKLTGSAGIVARLRRTKA